MGTGNICSSQGENRWWKLFLKGPLARETGAREVGSSKEDLRGGLDPGGRKAAGDPPLLYKVRRRKRGGPGAR